LLRHAKSSWDDPSLADADRPLNARGERAATLVGEWLVASGLRPGLVWCSPARRARQTLDHVRSALAPGATVSMEAWLYGADPEELLAHLLLIDDAEDVVLVIGHNPTLHQLAFDLSGSGDAELCDELANHFPTGAVALLELEEPSWAGLARGAGRLVAFVRPRELS
jgi:phosphohistidine phosphatase